MKTQEAGDRQWGLPTGRQSGIYVHQFENNKSTTTIFACRYNSNNTTTELYDLDKDISEANDISSDNPDVVKMAINYMNTAHVQGHYCGTHINKSDLD